MRALVRLFALVLACQAGQALALSLDTEEFETSRKMACVLAQQSLGQLTEDEYGEMTHSLLDGFDEVERDNILAQAVGYYGGLTFSAQDAGPEQVHLKLEDFIASTTCSTGFRPVTLQL